VKKVMVSASPLLEDGMELKSVYCPAITGINIGMVRYQFRPLPGATSGIVSIKPEQLNLKLVPQEKLNI